MKSCSAFGFVQIDHANGLQVRLRAQEEIEARRCDAVAGLVPIGAPGNGGDYDDIGDAHLGEHQVALAERALQVLQQFTLGRSEQRHLESIGVLQRRVVELAILDEEHQHEANERYQRQCQPAHWVASVIGL